MTILHGSAIFDYMETLFSDRCSNLQKGRVGYQRLLILPISMTALLSGAEEILLSLSMSDFVVWRRVASKNLKKARSSAEPSTTTATVRFHQIHSQSWNAGGEES
jgi:hypothetical protein